MIRAIRFIFLFLLLSLPAYAQTASILPLGRTQYFDNNGNPLSGGKVFNYIPGTLTFKNTWQDSAETILNANPVILDAAGRALIYGEGTYRQIVRKANNDLVWDAVTSATGSGGGGAGTGDGDLVGTIKPWSGITAPNQYQFAFGQELNRTTFAALRTAITLTANVICTSASNTLTGISDTSTINIGADIEVLCMPAGTTVVSKTTSSVTTNNPSSLSTNASAIFYPFGNGDGSTTFNVPDLRGYVIAGRCNMGGVSCTNLTTTYFGSNTPSAQGATGGLQNSSITLVTANLPAYTPTGTISSPTITSRVRGSLQDGGSISAVVTQSQSLGNDTTPSFLTTNPIFTGTAQGGTSTPILDSRVQPTITLSYIIKVTPDTNSSVATGVTSLGSMTGDITCGVGILCTGNAISVIPGAGAVVGPGVSTDNAIPRWDGTGGNLLKNSGVLIDANNNISGVNSFNLVPLQNTAAAFTLSLVSTDGTMLANRTLTFATQNGNRTISLAGGLTLGGSFTTSGVDALTLTVTAPTNVTLPVTGTLSTLTGSETFTNKTLTAPDINAGTVDSLTSLSVRNTAAAFDLLFASTDASMAANRTLTFNTNNGNRTIDIAGNVILSGAFTTSGSTGLLTQTYTGSPTVAFGSGGTVTYTSNNLSVFAATTSAQLFGVISDETGGAGVVVGNASPTFTGTVTSPIFNATTSSSAYAISGTTVLFVSGAYTQINSPATTSASLTFGNNTDSSMYITANSQIVIRNTGLTTYFLITPSLFQGAVLAVASLPTCNAGTEGSRSAVNNSNAASYTAGIGAVVAGGGTTHVPVYCDGTNWRIG